MIFDKLERMGAYRGLHANLDAAVDFLLSHNLEELPMGRTEILGERVFLNKMEAQALPASEKKFEIHRKYMDIQIDVHGSERVETGDVSSFTCESFSEKEDIGFGECPAAASCTLAPGNFTICMAGEPHKPGILAGPGGRLGKCVIKVRVEEVL